MGLFNLIGNYGGVATATGRGGLGIGFISQRGKRIFVFIFSASGLTLGTT